MNLPSRKTLFIFVACIFSVVLIFVVKSKMDNTPKPLFLDTALNNDAPEPNNLLDWSNSFTGTTTHGVATTSLAKTTVTDTFSKELFSTYVATQKDGELDPATKDAVVQALIDKYSNLLQVKDFFDATDIKTVSILDRDKIRYYGNTFLSTEDRGISVAKKLAAVKNVDLSAIGKQYEKIAIDLSVIPVPEPLAETHIGVINNYYRLGKVFELIQKTSENDPLKMMFLFKFISDSQSERRVLYTNISTFMKKADITFTSEESGAFWLKI